MSAVLLLGAEDHAVNSNEAMLVHPAKVSVMSLTELVSNPDTSIVVNPEHPENI